MEITMTSLAEALKNVTLTQNGAITHITSNSPLVDWFFVSGASRHRPEDEVFNDWNLAFVRNPLAALRLLAYCRDIRGGQGERRVSLIIMRRLAEADC